MGQKSKRKKLEKLYKEIESIVAEKEVQIVNISPLSAYLSGLQDIKDIRNAYHDERLILQYGSGWRRINHNEKNRVFIDALTELLNADLAIEKYGIKDALQRREDAFISFASECIGFSTQGLVLIAKGLEKIGLLSKITNARIKQRLYYECDDLSNKEGRELTELCFKHIQFNNVVDMLNIGIEKRRENETDLIRDHMMYSDARKLEKSLKTGIPFTLYRGFLINPLEMVRGEGGRIDNENLEDDYKGLKKDGDEYFRKWNAGKGVSFTYDKDIAGFFCYWLITFGGKKTYNKNKTGERLWGDQKSVYEGVPEGIRTKEEFIEFHAETYSKRIANSGMKPIICKLEVNPNDIKGFQFSKSEREVNLLPEDAKVCHYEIVSGKQIAEHHWNCLNRAATNAYELSGVYGEYKVSILTAKKQNGERVQIFADTEEVKGKVNEIKERYYKNDGSLDFSEVMDIFSNAAIELPPKYRSRKLTRAFMDFLLRKPERKLRRKGTMYLLN